MLAHSSSKHFQNYVTLVASAKEANMPLKGGHTFLTIIMGLEFLDAHVFRIVDFHLLLSIFYEIIGRKD